MQDVSFSKTCLLLVEMIPPPPAELTQVVKPFDGERGNSGRERGAGRNNKGSVERRKGDFQG